MKYSIKQRKLYGMESFYREKKFKLETSRFKSEISHLHTKQIAHILHAIQLPFIISICRVKYRDQFIRSSYLFKVLHIYLGKW